MSKAFGKAPRCLMCGIFVFLLMVASKKASKRVFSKLLINRSVFVHTGNRDQDDDSNVSCRLAGSLSYP